MDAVCNGHCLWLLLSVESLLLLLVSVSLIQPELLFQDSRPYHFTEIVWQLLKGP